jgi:hypothetical protein
MCFQLHRGDFIAGMPVNKYPSARNKNAKRDAWHFL